MIHSFFLLYKFNPLSDLRHPLEVQMLVSHLTPSHELYSAGLSAGNEGNQCVNSHYSCSLFPFLSLFACESWGGIVFLNHAEIIPVLGSATKRIKESENGAEIVVKTPHHTSLAPISQQDVHEEILHTDDTRNRTRLLLSDPRALLNIWCYFPLACVFLNLPWNLL